MTTLLICMYMGWGCRDYKVNWNLSFYTETVSISKDVETYGTIWLNIVFPKLKLHGLFDNRLILNIYIIIKCKVSG